MFQRLSPGLSALVVLTLLAGCGEEKKAPPSVVVAPPVKKSAEKPAEGQWGDVAGRIIWASDKLPVPDSISVAGNADGPACTKNGVPVSEAWVVDVRSKGLKNVFVWVEPVKGAKLAIHPDLQKVPAGAVEMDQPACMFIPHAVALRQGQSLIAKNSSSITHNFKWLGNPTKNPGGNKLIPPGSQIEIPDLVEEKLGITIACDIHRWMKGYVRVFDHPYFAVTDADGAFSIKNAPTGSHKLKYWHGTGGWLGGAAGKDGYDVAIKPGANKLDDKPFPELKD